MRGKRDPGECTFIPAKSVRLTDTTFPIDKRNVSAVLSIRDVRWEDQYGRPCPMRLSLEKAGYIVDPPFGGQDDVVV